MRLLFVSGTTDGGSGRSQRDLATQLVRAGHEVLFLVDDDQPAPRARWWYGQLSDLSVRAGRTPLAGITAWLRGRPGRRTRAGERDGLAHWVTPVPQNALVRTVTAFRPDVVVVNSIERWAWRLVRRTCSDLGQPVVLYVREEDSLPHVETEAKPDVLVANTASLAETLRARGHTCSYVPSVVDVSATQSRSSREVALAINPIAIKGSDLIWEMARRLPSIPFVVQEAWPLQPAELASVEEKARELPNVEFRRAKPPGPGLYGDARVLLVPYRVDSRPRVIPEAQGNGIPVIAGDTPALVEAMGDGGLVVPLEDLGAWTDAIRSLWADEGLYERLASAALVHAQRPEVAPGSIAGRFEELLKDAIRVAGAKS